MRHSLLVPARAELRFRELLRTRVAEEIQKRHLSTQDIAKQLDLLPSGAQALMEKQVWPIETALRVAERLKIKMDLEFKFVR